MASATQPGSTPVLNRPTARSPRTRGNELGDRSGVRRRGVEYEVDRPAGEVAHAVGHSLAVGGDQGAKRRELAGKGGTGGGDDSCAAAQGDLNSGEPDRRAGSVDKQRGPGLKTHRIERPRRSLDGHRQDGRLDGVKPVGHAVPAVEDRDVGGAGARLAGEVRRPEDEVSDANVVDVVPHRVDRPGDVVADAARQAPGHESAAQLPVGRVEPGRGHPHPDVAGCGAGDLDAFLAQHVGASPYS
jgi:hypothetical protein